MATNSLARFWHDRIDIWLPAAFGVGGLLLLVFLAETHESPSPFQARVYLTLLALSAAAFAALIPGLLNVSLSAPGVAIRAAGALAVFILVFFYEPAHEGLARSLHVRIDPKREEVFRTALVVGESVKALSGGSGARDTCGNGRDTRVVSCVKPEHPEGSLVPGTITAIEVKQNGNVTEWKVTTDTPGLACIEFRAATGACETLVSITGRAAATEKYPTNSQPEAR